MPQDESAHKGELPLVVASELVEGEWALVRLQLPVSFNFERDGAKLLRNIKSAVNLFFRPAEDE